MKPKTEICKVEVADRSGYHWYNCTKPIWKDGYCKIHHPESVKAREEKSRQRWEEKMENSPWNIIAKLKKENEELKQQIAELTKEET